MQRINIMRRVHVSFLLAACLLPLSSCTTTVKKAGAGAALPVAVVTDTTIVPFQAMGHSSNYLMQRGYEVDHYQRVGWSYTANVHKDNPADLIYYVPGVMLYPFSPLAEYEYYPLSGACLDTVQNKKPTRRSRVIY
jgi:hypothetical protein